MKEILIRKHDRVEFGGEAVARKGVAGDEASPPAALLARAAWNPPQGQDARGQTQRSPSPEKLKEDLWGITPAYSQSSCGPKKKADRGGRETVFKACPSRMGPDQRKNAPQTGPGP